MPSSVADMLSSRVARCLVPAGAAQAALAAGRPAALADARLHASAAGGDPFDAEALLSRLVGGNAFASVSCAHSLHHGRAGAGPCMQSGTSLHPGPLRNLRAG